MDIITMLVDMLKYLTNPANDTIILFSLTVIDTVLAVGWRIKQSHQLLSAKFKSGLLVNTALSFLPWVMGILNAHTPDREPLGTVIPVFTLAIALMMIQSVMANAVIYGVRIPTWAESFYERFLSAEVKAKEKKVEEN